MTPLRVSVCRAVHQRLVQLNSEAGTLRCWSVLRFCSSLLGRVVDSISPYLTAILVSGKQVSASAVQLLSFSILYMATVL